MLHFSRRTDVSGGVAVRLSADSAAAGVRDERRSGSVAVAAGCSVASGTSLIHSGRAGQNSATTERRGCGADLPATCRRASSLSRTTGTVSGFPSAF